MKRVLAGALALTVVAAVAGCGTTKPGDSVKSPPAAEEKVSKLVIGFVPSQDAAKIGDKVKPMNDFLTKELGIPVESFVGTNFGAVIEGMGSKTVDVGFLNSLSYVFAADQYGAQLMYRTARKGSTQYRAQLTVRTADNIPVCDTAKDKTCKTTFDALKGKKIAFVDPASTSGYLYPVQFMKSNGIKLEKGAFFAETYDAGSHDNAIKAVYNKTADASWTFEDARETLVKEFPDAKQKLAQVAFTDWIPNDTVSYRKGLPKETVDKLKAALKKYVESPEGKAVLTALYSIDGLADGKDAEYNVVRDMVKAINVDLKSELSKKK